VLQRVRCDKEPFSETALVAGPAAISGAIGLALPILPGASGSAGSRGAGYRRATSQG
jgi:hypothetical protein